MNDVKICSDQTINDHAMKLKVCGHPLRLKLLCMISREENPCVSELWECLDQPQPVISQHLATLKRHGIVNAEISGNRRIYSIIDPFVEEVIRAIS
ncbi:MAG: ArsR/SmtB family transcription factor [Spirochaetia bacterium]